MKTSVISFTWILLILGLFSCNKEKHVSVAGADTTKGKPRVEVKVSRKYDDKGNLIRFDSLYTSFYSNLRNDSLFADSLFRSFHESFNRDQPNLLDRQFRGMFFKDTLLAPDFFSRDFFLRRYELNDQYMRKMMRDMDSIKNRFYEEESKLRHERRNKK